MESETVLGEIVKKMVCSKCKDYLRPPIFYCTENTNVCGVCKEVLLRADCNAVIGVNKELENIGHLLNFPCQFHKFQCKTRILWSEARLHENECPFRQFNCPLCPIWNGTAANLKAHVKLQHTTSIISNNFNFGLQHENKQILHIMLEELYILSYNCDTDSGILWFTLKFVGPLEYAKRKHFKLTLMSQENVEYSERSQVQPATSWEIDETRAIKIDICVLRMKLQLRNENMLKVKLEIFLRTPLYNGNVDEGLLQDTECPVCQDYMMAPIYQCLTGHSICSYCSPKLKTCPTCRGKLSDSRNFALESISGKMYYKCMFSDDGCEFATLPKDIGGHEESCDFGFLDCPIKAFIPTCVWRGKLNQMSSHALEEHGFKF